jgi:hypothetical protein
LNREVCEERRKKKKEEKEREGRGGKKRDERRRIAGENKLKRPRKTVRNDKERLQE